MYSILKSIGEHYSGYVLSIILLSSYMLIIVDRPQFKKSGLKKEANISFMIGIFYAAVGIILYFISKNAPIK